LSIKNQALQNGQENCFHSPFDSSLNEKHYRVFLHCLLNKLEGQCAVVEKELV